MRRLCGAFVGAALLSACVSHTPSADRAAVAPMKTGYSLQRDVVYTPEHWAQPLRADFYRPDGAAPHPAVIVVHGGGWDARDRTDMDSICRKLARRGYAALNIEYRLAPAFLYPAQLEDVLAAVRFLRVHAAELNVDPRRIGGWGYSAGAHLVALAATRDGDAESRLQAVVAGGTPADLPHYPVSPIITRFLGGTFAQRRETWLDASPVTHVSAGDPPMFLYHGTADRLVYFEDTQKLQQALEAAGVPVELYLVRGAGHVLTFLLGFGAESAALDFLDRRLR